MLEGASQRVIDLQFLLLASIREAMGMSVFNLMSSRESFGVSSDSLYGTVHSRDSHQYCNQPSQAETKLRRFQPDRIALHCDSTHSGHVMRL